ncbi:hypothetical protein L3X38_018019 [Prunus dulcis]|uniref:C2H2-type domain-containing protein n=1 Tax=Prunus dulcis TaxID=3755 RepID=A0AAD4WB03_PRUDU|nr:hypothetical protein L3X38_018019 [Prunus dulcis]
MARPIFGNKLSICQQHQCLSTIYYCWKHYCRSCIFYLYSTRSIAHLHTLFCQLCRESLERRYASTSHNRILHLRNELLPTTKGDLSVSDYLDRINAIVDNLALAGQTVNDDELVQIIMNNLGPSYDMIVSAVQAHDTLITYDVFEAFLLTTEILMLEQVVPMPDSGPVANMVARGHGSTRGQGLGCSAVLPTCGGFPNQKGGASRGNFNTQRAALQGMNIALRRQNSDLAPHCYGLISYHHHPSTKCHVLFNEDTFPFKDRTSSKERGFTSSNYTPNDLLVLPKSTNLVVALGPPASPPLNNPTQPPPEPNNITIVQESVLTVQDDRVLEDVVDAPSSSTPPAPLHMVTRSQLRVRQPNPKYALTATIDTQYSEPSCFSQAVKQEEWRQAMSQELSSLQRNGTWTLVPCTSSVNLLPNKWVFKIKRTPMVQSNGIKRDWLPTVFTKRKVLITPRPLDLSLNTALFGWF